MSEWPTWTSYLHSYTSPPVVMALKINHNTFILSLIHTISQILKLLWCAYYFCLNQSFYFSNQVLPSLNSGIEPNGGNACWWLWSDINKTSWVLLFFFLLLFDMVFILFVSIVKEKELLCDLEGKVSEEIGS